MKNILRIAALILATGTVGLFAETSGAARYDASVEAKVTQKLATKKQFQGVHATTEDGIVTLTGDVAMYQQKLDAAKSIRKVANLQGVRNLIAVAGKEVPDAQLAAQLDRKLYYDRMGYDNLFNYITASVQNGVVVVSGEARTEYDRDSALALVNSTAGVKDVVNDIRVAPASIFDDQVRLRAARVIYRDPVLSRYAIDPAYPIRIVVDNGKLSLYGTVATQMEKNVAGIRANQVFGAFTVQNNLQVEKQKAS
ncbi:MAG: BON domain-containing protein [Acidobacteriaceae bacterium]|nr:BON domain-containing protein [Acidobacteriaceae bacterium]